MAEPQTPTASSEEQVIHQMYIGGVTLAKNGKLMAVAGACSCYDNMQYADVQGMWHWLQGNAAIQKAMADFNAVATAELVSLGDKYGVTTGKVTETQLIEMSKSMS